MGNSQKNDQKLISTVWLGVNDDWPSIMKEKLSRISEEWSTPLLLSLNRFSFKEQNKFRNKIKAICIYIPYSKQLRKQKMNNMMNSSNKAKSFCKLISIYYDIYRNNNEFLRQDIQLLNTGISDLTISTNYNSYKINDSQSISSKIENSIYVEDQNPQVQQFYVVFSCINDAFNSTRHPFIHFIIIFKEWTTAQFISIKNLQNNIQHIKQRLSKFQISSDLFLNFFIFSLNEYLGDFGEDLTEDSFNKYIKDKQNYFNLCLQHIYDDTLINHLIDVLNIIHNNSIHNFLQKIKHIQSKPEFFEIPKKYLNQENPFIQEISCLNETKKLKNPAQIFYYFTKTYFIIKDHLTRSASNFLIFQVTNYVIVHSNIQNFHALLHLLELFYCNSPILLKYNQSLEFISNIIIS